MSGSSTASRTSCFWISMPPMSTYVTSGFWSVHNVLSLTGFHCDANSVDIENAGATEGFVTTRQAKTAYMYRPNAVNINGNTKEISAKLQELWTEAVRMC